MPKVGGTEFPYTQAGMQKAKAWAEMTGKPMQMKKGYQFGGAVGRPMQNPRNLSAMGRRGDTAIRSVAGQPSHVNPMEAKMIDKFGKAGQQFAQRTGSGTTNPRTGLPEYWNPFKEAKKWWNKNIKPAGKSVQNWWEARGIPGKTLLDELGTGLMLGGALGSRYHPGIGLPVMGAGWAASCSSRIGKGDYWDCIKAGGAGAYEGATMPINIEDIHDDFSVDSDGNVTVPDQPHTGVDVTEWPTDFRELTIDDISEDQLQDWLAEYSDNTGNLSTEDIIEMILADEADTSDQPEPEIASDTRPLNLWGFSPFDRSSGGDWLAVMDKLLGEDTAAKGGYVRKFDNGGSAEPSPYFRKYKDKFPKGQRYPKSMTDEDQVMHYINNMDPKDNAQVKYTQKLLSLQGYYNGKEDGVFGPKTAKAIKEFSLDFNPATKAKRKGFALGGEVPAGRRMYGTNPRKKRYPMQTSTAGMPVRGMRGGGMVMRPGMSMTDPMLRSYKAGGKLPKGWHM